jgi:hypothetical protein
MSRLRGRAAVAPEMMRGTSARDGDHRGDALLAMPDGMLVNDVSVINPAAESYVRAAARADGAAAEARDALKIRNCREGGDGGAHAFSPLSMETYERLGKAAMQLLSTLAGIAAHSGGEARLRGEHAARAECRAVPGQRHAVSGGAASSGEGEWALIPGGAGGADSGADLN